MDMFDALIQGRNQTANAYFDLVQITFSTFRCMQFIFNSRCINFISIKVQRYGNFAQSEYFMLGMYVSIALIWTDYFMPLTMSPADGVLLGLFYFMFYWRLSFLLA